MQLLTDELKDTIPEFYSSEDVDLEEKMLYAKFFLPDANWTWYILEYDKESNSFFALVDGLDVELGYVSLEELEQVRGHMGLHVERDLYFTPVKYKELKI